jgi:hypothetical protein
MRRTSAARRSEPSERRVGTVRGPHSRRCGCTTAPPATRRRSSARLGRELRIARRIPRAFDLAKKPRIRSGSTSAAGGMAAPRDPCGAALGALRRGANLSARPFTTLEDELPNCHQRAAG